MSNFICDIAIALRVLIFFVIPVLFFLILDPVSFAFQLSNVSIKIRYKGKYLFNLASLTVKNKFYMWLSVKKRVSTVLVWNALIYTRTKSSKLGSSLTVACCCWLRRGLVWQQSRGPPVDCVTRIFPLEPLAT